MLPTRVFDQKIADDSRDFKVMRLQCEVTGIDLSRRHIGLTEPGKVGRHDMKPVRKLRDQVTEHVAYAQEAVQQQQLWRAGTPSLAIETQTIAMKR
jgi:hypothetical protein